MNMEIINKPLSLQIHGFSGTTPGKDYAGTAFKLMDRMWKVVRSNNLKNKGLNIWVYEPGEQVFAGVELESQPAAETGLEQKSLTLIKYAYYKHIGSYKLIPQAGQRMREELTAKGLEITTPYVEIYGHWTNDETKLETELLMALR